jgi:hypothetical protein
MNREQGRDPQYPPVQPQVPPGTPLVVVGQEFTLLAVWHNPVTRNFDMLLKFQDGFGVSWTYHVTLVSWGRPMYYHRWRQ